MTPEADNMDRKPVMPTPPPLKGEPEIEISYFV